VICQGAEVGADDNWAGFLAGTELRRSSRLRSGCARDDLVILTKTAAMPDARAAHITGAAFGAAQHARWEFVANPRWTVDAALFPDHDGKVAVATLRDALRGQEIARNMCNETIFVTADSLGSSYDISDCPDQ
jgi:hypothetical protein